jgi:hypothetical protein
VLGPEGLLEEIGGVQACHGTAVWVWSELGPGWESVTGGK